MEDTEKLFRLCLDEVDKMLSTKHVVGEPFTVEGNTLIPLIGIGFGFGAGGSSGTVPKAQVTGGGAGAGGGGGVRPIAVIVVGKDGVRVETLQGAVVSFAEKVAEVANKFVEKRGQEK